MHCTLYILNDDEEDYAKDKRSWSQWQCNGSDDDAKDIDHDDNGDDDDHDDNDDDVELPCALM